METKDKIKEKIEVAKSDIAACMNDFGRTGPVDSKYPIGVTHEEVSKSEVYHRGRLLGLEEALKFLDEPKTHKDKLSDFDLKLFDIINRLYGLEYIIDGHENEVIKDVIESLESIR